MSSNKKLTSYVSELDQLLQQFDQKNSALSASQKREIAKHQRVYLLRDNKEQIEKPIKAWDDF